MDDPQESYAARVSEGSVQFTHGDFITAIRVLAERMLEQEWSQKVHKHDIGHGPYGHPVIEDCPPLPGIWPNPEEKIAEGRARMEARKAAEKKILLSAVDALLVESDVVAFRDGVIFGERKKLGHHRGSQWTWKSGWWDLSDSQRERIGRVLWPVVAVLGGVLEAKKEAQGPAR